MNQRTEEERARIVKNCVRIEQAGGDVLEYLASEHYISPRATWFNIQRCDLERKELTDGRPKAGKQKKVELIPKDAKVKKKTGPKPGKYIKFRDEYREIAKRLIVGMSHGENPFECLRTEGYSNPWYRWSEIMKWAMKEDLDVYFQLAALYEQQINDGTIRRNAKRKQPLYKMAEMYAMNRE